MLTNVVSCKRTIVLNCAQVDFPESLWNMHQSSLTLSCLHGSFCTRDAIWITEFGDKPSVNKHREQGKIWEIYDLAKMITPAMPESSRQGSAQALTHKRHLGRFLWCVLFFLIFHLCYGRICIWLLAMLLASVGTGSRDQVFLTRRRRQRRRKMSLFYLRLHFYAR